MRRPLAHQHARREASGPAREGIGAGAAWQSGQSVCACVRVCVYCENARLRILECAERVLSSDAASHIVVDRDAVLEVFHLVIPARGHEEQLTRTLHHAKRSEGRTRL